MRTPHSKAGAQLRGLAFLIDEGVVRVTPVEALWELQPDDTALAFLPMPEGDLIEAAFWFMRLFAPLTPGKVLDSVTRAGTTDAARALGVVCTSRARPAHTTTEATP